jgi:hypothetical protein
VKSYLSHKEVKAAKVVAIEPFDEGFAHRFRLDDGSLVGYPQGKCPANPVGGYYVVYEDGYTSWSPAEAFEGGYTAKPTDWHDRLVIEHKQLADRLHALSLFIRGEAFSALPEIDRSRLLNQHRFMSGYDAVLAERLAA